MRAICLLSLTLLAAGYLAVVWESPESLDSQPTVDQARWVRTRDGWEHTSSWARPAPVYDPPIHPLALAGLQMGLSLAALIAFPAKSVQSARDSMSLTEAARYNG